MHHQSFLAAISLAVVVSCTQAPEPILPVPSPEQVEWQKMETYAFIHYGPNTYINKEWGYGDADPKVFNPARLDCHQWASTFKAAGMKQVILTTKHHDGFCLWPCEDTEYSVKNSLWKEGKGDLLAEFTEACEEEGLKHGFYLSPWDRNSGLYGSPDYVAYYYKQLRHILTSYGRVSEVWLDGANGGDGYYGGARDERRIDRQNYYNFTRINEIIQECQPGAIVFSDGGPGCRWVGNERGIAGETNWSFLRAGEVYAGYPHAKELTVGHADGDQWVPAECDVSIRPGWFYHESEDDQVKSVEHLMNIYYSSVGRNGTLLLNVPVNQEGLISPIDSTRLVEWKAALDREFAEPVLGGSKAGVTAEASNVRGGKYSAEKVLDDDYDSYWATKDGVNQASITFKFKEAKSFNRLMIQEYIPLGQRIQKFSVEVLQDGEWKAVEIPEETTTVGYKRLLRFARVNAEALRVNFLESRGPVVINHMEAFNAPE